MSALRDALLSAADALDADPVSDETLCKAIAACREACAFMGQELHVRAASDAHRRGYALAINRETQTLLEAMTREVEARKEQPPDGESRTGG